MKGLVSTIDIRPHHRTYSDTDWAMSEEMIANFQKIYDKLTPVDPVLADSWLFSYWPDLPEGGRKTDDETQVRTKELQINALKKIYDTKGKQSILQLIEIAPNPEIVGNIVAQHLLEKEEICDLIHENLGHEIQSRRSFASGAVFAIFKADKWDALENFLQKAKERTVSNVAIANIYLATKANADAWDRLEKENAEVQKYYWDNLNAHALNDKDAGEYQRGINKLLDYNRAPDVIDEVAYCTGQLSSETLVRMLELAPQNINSAAEANLPIRVSSHDIARVFEKLEQMEGVDKKVIAMLEVPFVSIIHLDRPKLVLHQEVLNDPTTFADLICWVYKRSDSEQDDDGISSVERERRADMAWHILHNIRLLPGQSDDGEINGERQIAWIKEARKLCAERGRDVVGRHIIGQILANSPSGKDGIWPCEEVRNTLDLLSDPEIGHGFVLGKQNLRGTTSRGVFDGGEPERNLAEVYRKDARILRAESPFTARLLNQIAEAYEHEATYHDSESDWLDR